MTMTGADLKAIRVKLCGATIAGTITFGRSIGCEGDDRSVAAGVRRLETYAQVPMRVELLARFRKKYGMADPR